MAVMELPDDPFDEMQAALAQLMARFDEMGQMMAAQNALAQEIVQQRQQLQQIQMELVALRQIAEAPAVPEYGLDGRIISARRVLPGAMN